NINSTWIYFNRRLYWSILNRLLIWRCITCSRGTSTESTKNGVDIIWSHYIWYGSNNLPSRHWGSFRLIYILSTNGCIPCILYRTCLYRFRIMDCYIWYIHQCCTLDKEYSRSTYSIIRLFSNWYFYSIIRRNNLCDSGSIYVNTLGSWLDGNY